SCSLRGERLVFMPVWIRRSTLRPVLLCDYFSGYASFFLPHAPRSSLFPYTTLFRSVPACECTGASRPVFMLAARRRRNSQPSRLRYEASGEPPSVVSHALGP